MNTPRPIDPELLERAVKSSESAKMAEDIKSLQELAARRQQRNLVELFGTLDWDDTFHYKAGRSRT